jgi:hypothetical protein
LIKPVLKSLIGVGKAESFKITPLRILSFGILLGFAFLASIATLIALTKLLS